MNWLHQPMPQPATVAIMVAWVLFSVAFISWYVWDQRTNWTKVGEKDGFIYLEHKRKRKRIAMYSRRPADQSFLRFKTDVL